MLGGCGGAPPAADADSAETSEATVPAETDADSDREAQSEIETEGETEVAVVPVNAPAADAPLSEQNYCLGEETLFHALETEGFWLNICGGDRPSHYVGVSKRDAKNIRRPLSDYSASGLWYEAFNGDTRYEISLHGEESPIALTVTDPANGDRVLVEQDVRRDQQFTAIAPDPATTASPKRNDCQANESVFVTAETENFWLNICGADLPSHCVGVGKADGHRLRLELSDDDPQGQHFTAKKGAIRYEIFLVGDPESLAVTDTHSGKLLVSEPIRQF